MNPQSDDPMAARLRNIAGAILTVVFGFLPLIFIPLPTAALEYTKAFCVIIAIAIAFILFSLSVLRAGAIALNFSYALLAFWVVVGVTAVSAVLSGDLQDALVGNVLGIHTTAFMLLLAATMTIWVLIGVKKSMIMRLFLFLMLSTLLLSVFHIARFVLGTDFLSFNVLASATATPIGGWNDLALFLGLTVLIALVTLEQLPLTKWGRLLFGLVVLAALAVLAVINFFFVWVVLGVISLVLLVYTLGKKRFAKEEPSLIPRAERSLTSLIVPLIVFIVSALFVLAGSFLGGELDRLTGISYIEVRPSVEATADIATHVYEENAFLGIGPNRFADAWRLYKDNSINQTIFWNTNFQSGSGYIPTMFVTTGVFGGGAWLLFFILFIFAGARMLLRAENRDSVWYFIGTASFAGALFVWGMSMVYVPGTTILLIGALCTGLTFVANGALHSGKVKTLTLAVNRRSGFLLTIFVICMIIGSVGVMYGAGRHYVAAYTFANSVYASQQPGTALDEVESMISKAYEYFANDTFARRIAEYQLARMNALVSIAEPTDAQRQQFQNAVVDGVNSARLATERDDTDPANWAVLGSMYSHLVQAEVEQSYELGKQALERARDLDPHNPLRRLRLAQIEIAHGNLTQARTYVNEAISLKSNYSDALFLISQIDIAEGDVDSAITAAREIISIEPQNPTRYYQLGVLELSRDNLEIAAAALNRAVALDANYANARYFLALTYSELGETERAKAELEQVLALNPGNELVTNLLDQLERTGRIATQVPETSTQPVEATEAVSETPDEVTTEKAPDTPLIAPVNTPAEEAE